METSDILKSMLTENTGAHFLDSGGAYGRNHERNQTRNFETEAPTVLDFSNHEPSITHRVYHWLLDRVEFDPEMDAEFQAFAKKPENVEKCWLENMEKFAESMSSEHCTINTYNGEDLLDQVLQYVYFETNGKCFVLLQIHGGCDVRGGYTAPKVFQVDEGGIYGNADATIYCSNSNTLPQLDGSSDSLECSFTQYTDDSWNWHDDAKNPSLRGGYKYSNDPKDRGKGVVYVDTEGHGYCPVCGNRLEGCY